MRQLLLFTSALLLGSFTSCQDDAPSAACCSGVVIGSTCLDGVLIEVTSGQPIGKPISYRPGTGLTANNVIAAVNDLGSLDKIGQTVYFTYTESPNDRGPLRACTTDKIPLAVPHLMLSNLGSESCIR